jgi:hypothetical protein
MAFPICKVRFMVFLFLGLRPRSCFPASFSFFLSNHQPGLVTLALE